MEVRLALYEDVTDIRALLADDELGVTREDMSDAGLAKYQAAFLKIDGDANNDLFVVERDGRLIATAQVTWIPYLSRGGNERCHVEAVRVASDLRGLGIGAMLMQFIVDKARGRGCLMVQLTTDLTRENAHRFYARMGFVATHHGMKLVL